MMAASASRLWTFALILHLGSACFAGTPLGFYPSYGYGTPYAAPPYSAVSRTRMASPSHTLTANSVDQLQTLSDCRQRFPNQRLQCAQPFDRRMPTSETECQQLCDQYGDRCRSIQFDTVMNGCDLFDVSRKVESKDLTLDGAFRRKRFLLPGMGAAFASNTQQLPQQSYSCEPSLAPAIGTTYIETDPNCRTDGGGGSFAPPPSEFVGAVEPMPTDDQLPPITTLNHQPAVQRNEDCVDGATARVQLIDGIEVNGVVAVSTVQLDSPDACLHICRLNSHLDGNKFSRPCRSAAFDRSNGRCFIFDGSISPNGDMEYTPNPNSIYFEKFCIPQAEVPKNCDDVLHRIPQHTLDRRAVGTGAVITAATQIQCIRQCLGAARQMGFECASVSYFFDWPAENCYLSRFTRLSRPDIYVAERKQFVDYLEMPKCSRTNQWQHDEVWSEWSSCDESLTRTRQRNCTDCKPRRESVPCISASAFQNEFPKSLIETERETKPIATSFDSARRRKAPPKDGEPENALFGETDYEHQSDVSFFGPPHVNGVSNHKIGISKPRDLSVEETESTTTSAFRIRSNIRPIATLSPLTSIEETADLEPPFGPVHSSQITDEDLAEFAKISSVTPQRTTTESIAIDSPLIQSVRDSTEQRHHDDATSVEEESPKLPDRCNPRVRCCQRLGENAKSARLYGCIIGYRLGADGRQTPCITDDYSTNSASTISLLSLFFFFFHLLFQ